LWILPDYRFQGLPKPEELLKTEIETIIENNIEDSWLGTGTPMVNVLKLNIALDNVRR
jgi:K+-transporting ATPase c subunit